MNNPSASIEPWLTVADSRKALRFYKSAFNASEIYLMEGEGEDLVAKLSVGGAGFWISNGAEIQHSHEGSEIRLILIVDNPDAIFLQALEAGATQIYPVGDQHGWRLGRLSDPFGIHWEIGHPLK